MAAIGGVPRTTNGGRQVLVSACSTRGGPGQEHQTKLANLDLVAVDQHRGVDRFTIDVSVVEAVEVDEQELSVLQSKLDVMAADGGVVEEDVAVRMPARRGDGLIEQELGTGVGPRITSSRAERLGGPSAAETRGSTPSAAGASNSPRR
jgi:hypothetical protein